MNKAVTKDIAGMFDRISRTYDLLNHLLSLGVDRHWRNKAINLLELIPGQQILDCGAGTGDMSLTALRASPSIRAVLLDPAQAMLSRADVKAGLIRPEHFMLVRGAAESLPFGDEQFDRFMVAFGIRNFLDLSRGLRELSRTLKRGGKGVILEFTPDRARWLDRTFQWYMKHIMEPVGARISRDRDAYDYLTRTVENFATVQELKDILSESGLAVTKVIGLNGGIAQLFVLGKAE